MGIVSRTVIAASALAGLAIASQAPEFAQQYRQRLGGAVDELRAVVADFDRDADRSGLTRDEALAQMLGAPDGFIHDRGASMSRTMMRFETLRAQLASLERANPIGRPLIVARNPDEPVARAAWTVFEPALPLTAAGLVYGAAGAAVLGFLASLLAGAQRRYRRRRRAGSKRAGTEGKDLPAG